MDIPDRLKPFFDDFARLSEAQEALFRGGDIGLVPAEKKLFVLPENTGDIELFDLCALRAGTGWGKTVMGLLVALADRHGLDVYLRAAAVDDITEDAMDQDALEGFYASFGFLDVGSWDVRDMVRRHAAPAGESERLLASALAGETLWQAPAPRRRMP